MDGTLLDEKREVKIRRKISLVDFAHLLKDGTDRIVISDSIVRQSKSLGIMLDTLERIYNLPNPPTIEILERGKGPRVIKQDWVDPGIRAIIGKRPPAGVAIEIRLYNEKALSRRKAAPLSEFGSDEIREISALKSAGHIAITDDLGVYLTRLGAEIARGAKRLYHL